MRPLLRTVEAACASMARVGLVGAMGGYLSRRGVLDGASRRSVAKLLTNLLLPMLLFTKVSAAVESAGPRLVHWLVLLLYVGVHVGAGALASTGLLRFWRPPKDFEAVGGRDWIAALVVMTVSFPNSGSLPLALVDSLCGGPLVSALGDDCLHQTVGYVSFYFSFLNPIMWLVCPRLLLPPATQDTRGTELVGGSSYGPDDDDERDDDNDERDERDNDDPPGRAPPPLAMTTKLRAVLTKLRGTPPPVCAAILGVVVGAVPGVRRRLLESTVLGSAAELVGNAAIPVGIVNLGAAVAANALPTKGNDDDDKGERKRMPLFLVAAVPLLRLVVVPAASVALTALLRRHDVLVPRRDRALALVLMLEAAPPPAMQTMVFVTLFDQSLEGPLAQLLVSSYLVSLLTLTAWIALILSLVIGAEHDDNGVSS